MGPLVTDRRQTAWIHDLAGVRVGAIRNDLDDISRDTRLDERDELTVDVSADSDKVALLTPDGIIEWDDTRFAIDELEDIRGVDGRTIRRARAVALWQLLADERKPGTVSITAATAAEGLTAILTGTGWTTGDTTRLGGATASVEMEDPTVLALLRKWAQATGGYLTFDTLNRTVSIADGRGQTRGMAVRHGRNLTSIRRRSSPPKATRLYPYGAGDLGIAGVTGKPYVEDLSYYTGQGLTDDEARALHQRTRIVSDPTIVDEATLLEYATNELAKLAAPTITYECSVVDLSELTGLRETITVGDRVRVVDAEFGVDQPATVVRTVKQPLAPWSNTLELSFVEPTFDDGSTPARGSTADAWEQFVQGNLSAQQIRNDISFTVARIPLAFRENGRANFHLDIYATGIGAGTMYVEVVDAVTGERQHRELGIPYTNGQVVHDSIQWAYQDLTGEHDYRVRVRTVSTGGPSAGLGVNIAADEARFWILAQAAIRQTPTSPNTARFDYTGTVETWQVPDGVTELVAQVYGGAGGKYLANVQAGGYVSARIPVTPGEQLDVTVGRKGGAWNGPYGGGWPDGGDGDRPGSSPNGGGGGGGSSCIVRNGLPAASALVVAGGGGGSGQAYDTWVGGAGGFFTGGSGAGNYVGQGATQFAGGAGGISTAD